jgi:hypothetical protein
MGREVKRVDMDFDWFERTTKDLKHAHTWIGYVMDAIPCPLCKGSGKSLMGKQCCLCYGEGTTRPHIEVPEGEGWQMWEDCTEGSPISPVFKTSRELARWLAKTGASAMGTQTATEEEWKAMIKQKSVCSMVFANGQLKNGVAAAKDD